MPRQRRRQKNREESPTSTTDASTEECRNTQSPQKPWETAHPQDEFRETQLAHALLPPAESPSAAVPCPRLAIVAARQSSPPSLAIGEKCGQSAAQQHGSSNCR